MDCLVNCRKIGIFIILLLIWCAVPSFAVDISISAAKLMPDSTTTSVSLKAKVVTYAAANYFYIEEDNRNMGIRVEKTAHGLTVGMRADVIGAMKTNASKERAILASLAIQTASPNSTGTVSPVGMNSKAIGGGNWHVVGTGGQRGATDTIGVNNTGLLVRTWGQYQQVDATTFTVEDGSGLYIKCTVPTGAFLHSGWQYVSVTGISSIYKINNFIYLPNILVRDISVVLPLEVVSSPGTPSGNTSPVVNVSEVYSTTGATSNYGHTVEYRFNWGDGASSTWSTSTSASHAWSALGTKTVTVTARCQAHPSVMVTSAGRTITVIDQYTGEMISIPAGSFAMGTLDSYVASHNADEHPQHPVALGAYSIGKYEVTRGEYRKFINAGGYSNVLYWSTDGWSWKVGINRTEPTSWTASQNWGTPPGAFTQTDNHPVVGVCYYEAEAFCNWAVGHLPTEAQWERAARWTGSRANVFPWGDTWDAEKCNNWNDSLYPGSQTAPFGSYSSFPSPSGCQDMAGNAWEWCKDWYLVDYYSQSPTSDPQGPASGSSRVLRGG
ncbi:MAG: SUMF1/EgtB/PvdO family nonheme iron enzyme [Armatimonadetes bacterium]|nr:SUMF1/EgtB/PvdO family nonheme iron enzyme [Armatimonadota bacterium]